MGWRDMLEAAAEEVDFGTMGYDGPAALLLTMPPADRIALARELLEGTGKAVAEVPRRDREVRAEYHAARAAMLGDEG